MELLQVMSLVLLLLLVALEQVLLVKEVLKVVKEVEEVEALFLSSLSLNINPKNNSIGSSLQGAPAHRILRGPGFRFVRAGPVLRGRKPFAAAFRGFRAGAARAGARATRRANQIGRSPFRSRDINGLVPLSGQIAVKVVIVKALLEAFFRARGGQKRGSVILATALRTIAAKSREEGATREGGNRL